MDTSEKMVHTQSSSSVQRKNSQLSKKESVRRERRPGKSEQRLDISDLYPPQLTNDDENLILQSHILETANCDQVLLGRFVANELRDIGVTVENNSIKRSASKGRKPANLTFHPNTFLESVEAKIDHSTIRLNVPHVVKLTCEFIRKDIGSEGIFRKSGLASRIRSLKKRFDEKETGIFEPDDTVFDASSVLKQYLRELPCPLIPYDIQPIFLKCLEKPDEKTVVESILLCIYLLPLPNIHIISYLMGFLHEITKYSHLNRMGHKNLALVMTPNIMPVEIKKSTQKGKDVITIEKAAHENHRKVVEILILYGDYVGWVSKKLKKTLDTHQSMCRNSEDELDIDISKDGRRKKRRSGSLTSKCTKRFFMHLGSRLTNGKGSDTPGSTIETANDIGPHTPAIKGVSKKRNHDEPLFSSTKKKTILDAVRRHGLYGDDPNSNFSPGLITCPSPAICLDPSPMRTDWRNTPKLITPSLLRDKKRSKSARETERITLLAAPMPTPLKGSSKNKVGFGRKSGKKAALIQQQVQERLQKSGLTASAVSIHHLTDSPRKPPRSNIPPPKPPRNLDLNKDTEKDKKSVTATADRSANGGDGVYVTISNSATTDDPKNEAFIASSNTLNLTDGDDDEPSPHNDVLHNSKVGLLKNQTTNGQDDVTMTIGEKSFDDNTTPEILRLTPLIREINTLTMFAQQDDSMTTISDKGKRRTDDGGGDVESSSCRGITSSSPRRRSSSRNNSACPDDGTPSHHQSRYLDSPAITKVTEEFERTTKEKRIIHLTSEMKTKRQQQKSERIVSKQSPNVQRCPSLLQQQQPPTLKGVSPAQRRINSFRRRRSHDPTATSKIKSPSMVTPSPRFMSLRSPRSRPTPPPPLIRSPSRCTLRRGRPNTAGTGLPKPSPCRNVNGSKLNSSSRDSPRKITTPTLQSLRRPGPVGGTMGKNNNNIKTGIIVPIAGDGTTTISRLRPRNEMGTTTTAAAEVVTPTMRRMSSVQELVQKLESKVKSKMQTLPKSMGGKHRSAVEFGQKPPAESIQSQNQKLRRPGTLSLSNITVVKDRQSLPSNSGHWEVRDSLESSTSTTTGGTSKLKNMQLRSANESTSRREESIAESMKMPPPTPKTKATGSIKTTPYLDQGSEWTNAVDFNFDNNPMRTRSASSRQQTPASTPVSLSSLADRESIHVLKTRNAGKVSESVRMFDGMVRHHSTKSPVATKSLIPRYTALHASNSRSQLQNNNI